MTGYLKRHGIQNPRFTSEILISNVLNIERIQIYASHDNPVNDEELDRLRELSKRIAGGEPLQLVVGDSHFLSYVFKVEPGVFIPRPETEVLVEVTVNLLEKNNVEPEMILDIGTGTGVIAISLLHRYKAANAMGVDISIRATALASENARLLNIEDRIRFIESDLFENIDENKQFDLIVSNPPYIPSVDIPGLDPVVRDFDPHAALDGGKDGFATIRNILKTAPSYLKPGGLITMEIGINQAGETSRIFNEAGLVNVEAFRDLSGVERIVTGWKEKRH